MIEHQLPRFTRAKRLKSGATAFFWEVPSAYRKLGCAIKAEPLGSIIAVAFARAAGLNAQFDEWNITRKGDTLPEKRTPVGTVAWLFRTYRTSLGFLNKVSPRSRPDYERVMQEVEDCRTNDGRTVGQLRIDSISPAAVDKIYRRIIEQPRQRGRAGAGRRTADEKASGGSGERLRQAEKAVTIAARAWKVVQRLHPEFFAEAVPNPWAGVEKRKRTIRVKPAVTRAEVYAFARGAIALGKPEAGAAAVICFEWLQRPENVLAGYVQWSNYRSSAHPAEVKIEHHKTGAVVWHWLEDPETGERYYDEAEAILAATPRRGIAMVLKPKPDGTAEPYTPNLMGNLVRTLRGQIEGVPPYFSLDACRHGGMTELEEAGLTDGQGRALSGHRSRRAYEGYAKDTAKRALTATRKRFGAGD
jgi:hypothetical protein